MKTRAKPGKKGAAETLETPHDGTTRKEGAPLDEGSAEAFEAVQPARFRDHPGSAIDAAVADPDADDTIGGE